MEKRLNPLTVLDFISQDKQERMLYEARQKAIMDYNSNMYCARLEGRLEGKLEGISEGEMKSKIQIAKSMLKKGIDAITIAELTGIDVNKLN